MAGGTWKRMTVTVAVLCSALALLSNDGAVSDVRTARARTERTLAAAASVLDSPPASTRSALDKDRGALKRIRSSSPSEFPRSGGPSSVSDGKTDRGRYTIVVRGIWTQNSCLLTSAEPDAEAKQMSFTCTGTATYKGQLDGYAVQDAYGTAYADGSNDVQIAARVYARLVQNLCGAFDLDERGAVDPSGAASGVGPITGVSGDFEGMTGYYDTSGLVPAGVGTGGYKITMTFPRKPIPSADPCTPPVPTI